jgi:hypothetical protein
LSPKSGRPISLFCIFKSPYFGRKRWYGQKSRKTRSCTAEEIFLPAGDFFALRTANGPEGRATRRVGGSRRPQVKKRIGDRRGRVRFEIVGTLTGTLETLRRSAVRNLGSGGALVETSVPLSAGSQINGRLSFRGRTRDVRGLVRHITTLRDSEKELRYLVGIEWVDTRAEVNDLLSHAPLRPAQSTYRHSAERRVAGRFNAGGEAEIGEPTWSTVEVVDISTSGVLFVSPQPLDVGETGQLRMRLGERSFAAQVEVRRSDTRKTPHPNHRLGATFVSLDEVNRVNLEDFVGDARR